MTFIQAFSDFAQGYFWATVLAPVEWYFAKPMLIRVYDDAVRYVNPMLAKFTTKQLPAL